MCLTEATEVFTMCLLAIPGWTVCMLRHKKRLRSDVIYQKFIRHG